MADNTYFPALHSRVSLLMGGAVRQSGWSPPPESGQLQSDHIYYLDSPGVAPRAQMHSKNMDESFSGPAKWGGGALMSLSGVISGCGFAISLTAQSCNVCSVDPTLLGQCDALSADTGAPSNTPTSALRQWDRCCRQCQFRGSRTAPP